MCDRCETIPGAPFQAQDMDIVGALFAFKIEPREEYEPLVHLFVEDDEWYHYECTFSSHWLKDLVSTANATVRRLLESAEPVNEIGTDKNVV